MVEHKLYGILSGIDMDRYDPRLDQRIPHAFSVEDMTGKAACKAGIQKKFDLPTDFDGVGADLEFLAQSAAAGACARNF